MDEPRPPIAVLPSISPANGGLLNGTLHIYVALDFGEEIDLEHVTRLVPASFLTLARRPRTPSSISYQPLPLQLVVGPLSVDLAELGTVEAAAEITVFDFGAVSLAMHVPFSLTMAQTLALAGSLSEPHAIVQVARDRAAKLYERILPAIQQPAFSTLNEEYFVFHLPPGEALPPAERLLADERAWIAGLVRLEDEPLSADEVAEALRVQIRYTPEDLLVPEWSAALLIDRECEETLQTVAVVNLQLLEYRHLDNRLDDRLARAYKLIHPLARSWRPFWRTPGRQLRELGELRMDVHDLFERTGNVLKLVGDPYLARVYRLLATRFHLDEWQQNIGRALAVAENVYQIISDQAESYRIETLEMIVILLILVEIVTALIAH